VFIGSNSLLPEKSRRYIDGMAAVHAPAAFPPQLSNNPVGHIRLFSLLHRRWKLFAFRKGSLDHLAAFACSRRSTARFNGFVSSAISSTGELSVVIIALISSVSQPSAHLCASFTSVGHFISSSIFFQASVKPSVSQACLAVVPSYLFFLPSISQIFVAVRLSLLSAQPPHSAVARYPSEDRGSPFAAA
jgi:hypothetical protein